MLQYSIDKEALLKLADAFIADLDPQSERDRAQMAGGLQLYREGRVYNVSSDGYMLEGTVEADGRIFSVSIPVTDVKQSYCDCFEPKFCEHLAAVLLYAGSSFGAVGEITKRFKNKGKPVLPELKTAKQLLAAPFTEDDYASWTAYFQAEYEKFQTGQKRHSHRDMYVLMSIFEDFYTALLRKAPRTPMLRELFELNAALFSFARLLEMSQLMQENKVYSYFKPESVADRFLEELHVLLRKLTSADMPERLEPLLHSTAAAVHELFFTPAYYCLDERFSAYRLLWHQLLAQPEWTEEELGRIAGQSDTALTVLAAAHMHFLRGDDEAATAALGNASVEFIGLYYDWLLLLEASGEISRMPHWLSFLYGELRDYLSIPHINQYYKRDAVRHYLTRYAAYAQEANDMASYEALLDGFLPYSFFEYNVYLLNKKQYRTWAELHVYMGFSAELEGLKDDLKLVEKEDREAVLPLYHRAVIQAVEMKNRPAYKLAVRYLKKLRTHYKKLKRTHEWDAYLAMLTARYARLRALREELQKGKLLDGN